MLKPLHRVNPVFQVSVEGLRGASSPSKATRPANRVVLSGCYADQAKKPKYIPEYLENISHRVHTDFRGWDETSARSRIVRETRLPSSTPSSTTNGRGRWPLLGRVHL